MGAPCIVVAASPEAVAQQAMQLVLAAEARSLAERGCFRVALAGGETPRLLYERLAASAGASFADWHVFFGDERWVPPDDPSSNQRMAREALLDRVPVPRRQVHAIDTRSGSPEGAAFLYSLELRRRLPPGPGGRPVLDLVLLGVGADGHTASLFPGSSALVASKGQAAVATWVQGLGAWRVTLTVAAIAAAREVLFVVTGRAKASALERVLVRGDVSAPACRVVHEAREVTFVVDEEAASMLPRAEGPCPTTEGNSR